MVALAELPACTPWPESPGGVSNDYNTTMIHDKFDTFKLNENL